MPETGDLYWIKDVSLRARKGMVAGTLTKAGYWQVRLNNRTLKSHRVCWILHYGNDPTELVVAHDDGNNANNKIENLLLMTISEVKRASDQRRGCARVQ